MERESIIYRIISSDGCQLYDTPNGRQQATMPFGYTLVATGNTYLRNGQMWVQVLHPTFGKLWVHAIETRITTE